MMKKLSLLAFSAIAFFGYSQEVTTTEVKPEFESKVMTVDRGAYTRPGQNIRRGLQLEYGLNYEWSDSDNPVYKTDVFSPMQAKLRWGLSDHVELNFNISNNQMVLRPWDEATMSKDKYNYWSPLDIGVRAQFIDSKKKCATNASLYVGLGVVTTVRKATDDNGAARPWVLVDRPTYVTPEFGLFVDHTIAKRLNLGYNAGLKWTGMALDDKKSSKNPDFFYTVRALFHATKSLDVYAEHFGKIRKVYYPTMGMNFGARYAITKKFVFDINGGLGFNSTSPDAFAGLGLSYKLGK